MKTKSELGRRLKVRRSRLNPFAVAAIAVAAVLLLELLLNPLISTLKSPLMLFFTAITISAWYGGRQAGTIATALAAGVSVYLIFLFSPLGLRINDAINIGLFLLEGWLLSVLSQRRFTTEQLKPIEAEGANELRTQLEQMQIRAERVELQDHAQAEQLQQFEIKSAEIAAVRVQMQTVLDHTPVSIYITDIDGYMRFTNTEYDQVFGQKFGTNLVGLHLSEFLAPEAVATYLQEHQPMLATGNAPQKMMFETEWILPDGVHTYLRMKFPLKNATGEIHSFCNVALDITVPRKMEAAIKNLEQQLQQKNEQIEKVEQLKLEFLAKISRYLRTPLTSILGLSNLLLEQTSELLTTKQQEYLSLISSNGQHLLLAINDLLDLAKIEAGKLELNLVEVDVAELCQQALKLVEVQAQAKRQHLSIELPVAIKSIMVDRQRVLQILINYLSIAIKFTKKGGAIALSTRLASGLELATQSLQATTSQSLLNTTLESRFLILVVNTRGIGMPLEKQELLFHTFEQIDTINHKDENSDLGLILSRQLAELHKGTVSFSSIPEVGSAFSIWLPLLKN